MTGYLLQHSQMAPLYLKFLITISIKVPFGNMCEEKKRQRVEYHKRTANAQFMKSCVGCQLHYTLNLVNGLTWWIVTANGVQGGYLWLSCKQVSGEEKEKSFEGSEPMSAKLKNLEIKAIRVDREPDCRLCFSCGILPQSGEQPVTNLSMKVKKLHFLLLQTVQKLVLVFF